jgi:hypothetical protein
LDIDLIYSLIVNSPTQMLSLKIACLIGVFILPQICFTAPTLEQVTGLFKDGSEVIISGTEFSANTANIQFLGGKNGLIETAALDLTPANTGGWIFNQGVGCNMKISDHDAHSGTKSLFCEHDSYNAAVRYNHSAIIGPNQKVFVSWWVRRTHVGDGQWKMFRVNKINDIQDGAPEITMFNWYNSRQFFVRINFNSSDPRSWSMPYPQEDSRWYRMDFELHTSSIVQSDGFYKVSLHDPSNTTIQSNSITGMTFQDSESYYKWFLWQNYMGNGIGNRSVWLDDLFIQVGSVARVELGDSSSWNESTFREIQRPIKWTDTQVTIDLNTGAFKSGAIAYLFIVDDNGTPSVGYPIRIGQSAGKFD